MSSNLSETEKKVLETYFPDHDYEEKGLENMFEYFRADRIVEMFTAIEPRQKYEFLRCTNIEADARAADPIRGIVGVRIDQLKEIQSIMQKIDSLMQQCTGPQLELRRQEWESYSRRRQAEINDILLELDPPRDSLRTPI